MKRVTKIFLSTCLSVLMAAALVPTAWAGEENLSAPAQDLIEEVNDALATGDKAQLQSDASVTPGWEQIGTCEWRREGDSIILRPMGNSAEGVLPQQSELSYVFEETWPWSDAADCAVFHIEGSVVCSDTAYYLFGGLHSLERIEGLENLDTSNATSLARMFQGCSSLSEIDLSTLKTSKVTDMCDLFRGCSLLVAIDLSALDASSLLYVNDMFYGCTSLAVLNAKSFSTLTLDTVGLRSVFDDCDSLQVVEFGKDFTLQGYLPDKTWYNEAGEAFVPTTIPKGVAGTYATSKDLLEPLHVRLSETSKTLYTNASPFALVATATPEWRAGTIIWSSSDPSVATVDQNGLVTVHGKGEAIISAETNGASASCELTVLPVESEEPENPGGDTPPSGNLPSVPGGNTPPSGNLPNVPGGDTPPTGNLPDVPGSDTPPTGNLTDDPNGSGNNKPGDESSSGTNTPGNSLTGEPLDGETEDGKGSDLGANVDDGSLTSDPSDNKDSKHEGDTNENSAATSLAQTGDQTATGFLLLTLCVLVCSIVIAGGARSLCGRE
ncbi:BspA family leucine-rich repeat surface protein [Adlercreutzia agrestimuris]|uniref:BspA family leucine-rich repeat surface protein n=1 Tax=Adlercreutzia agrestimuris TaxID=2941324 RepID=UPI00203A3B58|nr:BspA family leucine-rich repeat surface protein [Adlercreutzia agrestimuris]